MTARTVHLLVVLFCLVAFVGCEGDPGPTGPAGPTGPQGPSGPSMVLCIAEIDGSPDPGVVVSSWPADVTIAVADQAEGIWNITMTGTFPATEGTVVATVSDSNAGRSITSYITGWSTTEISIRVGTWNVIGGAFLDTDFSFMVLAVE
jgi:hypothetical protein